MNGVCEFVLILISFRRFCCNVFTDFAFIYSVFCLDVEERTIECFEGLTFNNAV